MFCLLDKTFIDSSNMKQHERIHSEQRPYACSFCDKSFKISTTLKNHEKIHKRDNQFICSLSVVSPLLD